ncbi:MAG: tetratricopeptide repeat protein [Deltaproteobacteria bacterium]|nr:tetratricopeptide repeat protein [Deltaproteobacteria bacterium]
MSGAAPWVRVAVVFGALAMAHCRSAGSQGQGAGGGASGGTSAPSTDGDSGTTASADVLSDAVGSTANTQGFRELSQADSAEVRRLFSEGTTAYGQNDFTTAAARFRAAYEIDHSSVAMAFNLARVYERIGEVTDAISFFERVVATHPGPEMEADIARRIAALREYEQRRSAGISQPPATGDQLNQEGVTWFGRGVRFYQRGQLPQALQAFEEAARFLQTPELYFNLGMTYERMRNYPRAIEYLEQFAEARRGTAEEDMIRRRIAEIRAR